MAVPIEVSMLTPFLLATAALSFQSVERAPAFEPAAAGAVRVEIAAAGIAASVSTDGLLVTPTRAIPWVSTPEWAVTIRTVGVGRRDALDRTAPSTPIVAGSRAELARSGWTEWFETTPRGVRQNWTIDARPAGPERAPLRIALSFEGDLVPYIADGGQSLTLKNGAQEPVLLYHDLRAWDVTGRTLDAHLRPSPWGLGIEVDDAGAQYPITVDPVATPAVWTWESTGANSGTWTTLAIGKTSVATAGDVNGDGYSDVLVGVQNASTQAGAVHLFLGSAAGPALTPSWSYTGPVSGGALGASLASAGDTNGDGFDDFVVGAPLDNRVYFWLGSSSGPVAASPASYTNGSLSWIGASCAPVGDVNGDGFDDVAVGAPRCAAGEGQACNSPSPGQSYVLVFLGSASGPSATPWMTNLGLPGRSGLGWSVSGAGDVNADGYADVAVSSPWFPVASIAAGRVHVFHGSPGFSSDFTADWTGTAIDPAYEKFGFAVAGVGDLDGDGYADLAVGAPEYRNSGGSSGGCGRLFLYRGGPGGLESSPSSAFEGSSGSDNYGVSVSPAGDLDADGFADLIVGAPFAGTAGAAYVVHGRPLPFGTVVGQGDQSLLASDGTQFGCSVSGAGDVDGDGRTDVVVGGNGLGGGNSPSRAVALLGRASTPSSSAQASLLGSPSAVLGRVVATAGFVNTTNQDARSDLLVGSPDANGGDGEVRLHLGLLSGLDTSAVWTSPSLGTGARAGSALAAADVANDGKNDVLIGCPQFQGGQVDEGRVVLFAGTPSGALGSSPAWTFESDSPGALLGSAVAFVGDVNGDGFNDVVAGAPGDATQGADAGAAYLFLGGTGGLSATPARVLRGQAGWRLGAGVSPAGDVNRDGFSDVLIGSPGYSNGQVGEGRVDLFLGIPQGLMSTAAWTVESDLAGAQYGLAMAAAGDVNNDGFSDVLVATPNSAGATGHVRVYHGLPGSPPSIALVLDVTLVDPAPQTPNRRFGASVAGVGDVNGDSFADIVVGAPGDDAGGGPGADRGSLTLYFGSSVGIVPVGPELSVGGTNGGQLGTVVSAAGDLNADGIADYAGGAPGGSGGALDIYIGSGITGVRHNVNQRRYNDIDCVPMLGLGESAAGFMNSNLLLNSSGSPSTPMGRGRVSMQWETKALAVLLDGAGLAQTPFSPVGLHPVGSPFQGFDTGLSLESSFHWRSRFEIRNPYLPHTPWLTVPGNSREEKKLGTGLDCNGNGVPDALDLGQPGIFDCNGNAWPDVCDIASGFEADWNANQVPDSCDIASNPALDCNGNGILDGSDIASLTSPDCNGNARPDECDLIQTPISSDCDGNSVPDECEFTPSGAGDCNGNSIYDGCDVLPGGASADTNNDGVPDECQGAIALFCPGDGTGAACPCANSSAPGANVGCLSSLGTGGRLRASGVPSVAADTLVLSGDQMPNSSALYFQGVLQQSGGAGVAFGDGLRCAGGSTIRLGTKTNASGASQYPGAGDLSISVRGAVPPGDFRTYQVWYRNAAAFCTASTFNLTNGVLVNWAL